MYRLDYPTFAYWPSMHYWSYSSWLTRWKIGSECSGGGGGTSWIDKSIWSIFSFNFATTAIRLIERSIEIKCWISLTVTSPWWNIRFLTAKSLMTSEQWQALKVKKSNRCILRSRDFKWIYTATIWIELIIKKKE